MASIANSAAGSATRDAAGDAQRKSNERDALLRALLAFCDELATADLDEIAADGGITVGMVFQQQARSVWAPRIQAALVAPGVRWGCHVDLFDAPNQEPDGCVLDYGAPEDCVYAHGITRREQCKYWRPVSAESIEAAQVEGDRSRDELNKGPSL